jgi:hypothetical protein
VIPLASRHPSVNPRQSVAVSRCALILLWLLFSSTAHAQTPGAPEPFRITDNSFLVEEAFNQEKGVFQNIFGAVLVNGEWAASFTQEWPLGTQTHQISYTLAWVEVDPKAGAGDTLINYRYQAIVEGSGRPAFSPRVSLVLPTGNPRRGTGNGTAGLQVNLPFSKQTGDWYWHWNAGITWLPRAKPGDSDSSRREDLESPFVAGSAIYRALPMVHLMLESVLSFDETIAVTGTERSRGFTLSPGVRGGWDVGEKQVVLGLALPTTWRGGGTSTGVFVYLSYELPFTR